MVRVNIIRKGSALMHASARKFKILDITNYLAPCSYSAYLKHFISRKQKDFFPYNHIKNYNSLLMKHFTGDSTTEICSTVIYFTVKEKACKCICFQTTTIIISTHTSIIPFFPRISDAPFVHSH